MKSFFKFASVGVVFLFGLAINASAAIRTWSGGGADNFWNTPANFSGTVPANNDSLVFGANAVQQINTNNIPGLITESILFTTAGWTLYGNPIINTNGLTNTTASGTVTFNSDLTFGNNQTLSNAAGAMIFGGSLNLNGKNFTINNVGPVTLNGPIGGAGNWNKNFPGTLFLSATNTFIGSVTLNQGIIELRQTNALGAASAGTTIASGPTSGTAQTIRIDLNPPSSSTIPEPLTLQARQGPMLNNAHVRNAAFNNILSGTQTLTTGGSRYNYQSDAGKLTIAGVISPSGLTGTRELRLAGNADGEITRDLRGRVSARFCDYQGGDWSLDN